MKYYTHTHTHTSIYKPRDLNLDLLKIICAICIIASHFSDVGGIAGLPFGVNEMFGYFLNMLGAWGVNCFVLISGYYLLNSKFKIKKLLKIVLQVIFYSVILYIISGFITERTETGWRAFLPNIFPISYDSYWFATKYVTMYMFFPFMNKFVNRMNQEEHKKLIIVSGITFSVIPTIMVDSYGFISNFVLFPYLYFIATYIRKYNIKCKNKMKLVMIIIACITFIIGFESALRALDIDVNITKYINREATVPMVIMSIATVLLFQNINIKIEKSSFIPFFSKATFGTYLIHINGNISEYLYKTLLHISSFYYAHFSNIFVHVMECSLAVFLVCAIIDTLRRKILEEPLFKTKIFDKYFEKVDNFMNE